MDYTGLYSARELLDLELPEEPFLVDQVIPSGGLVLLHGKRGIGKSQFALTLAHAVSKGLPLFGKYGTQQGKVLIVQVDMPISLQQMRLRQAEMLGLDGLYFFVDTKMDVTQMSKADRVVQAIHQIQPSLVVWDTLRRIHPGKENQSESVQAVYSAVKKYVPKPTHMFVHHDKKTQIDRDGELDPEEAFRGSTDWIDSVDASMQVFRVGNKGLRFKVHKCRTMAEEDRPGLDVTIDRKTLLLVPSGTSVPFDSARNHILQLRALSNGRFDHHGAVLELVSRGYCDWSQAEYLVSTTS